MTAAVSSYSDKLNKALYQKGMVSPDEFNQLCNEHYSYVLFLKVGDMFKILEENSGVQRLYIAYGIIGLTISWLAFGFGGQLVAKKQGKYLQVGNFHQFGRMKTTFNHQLERSYIGGMKESSYGNEMKDESYLDNMQGRNSLKQFLGKERADFSTPVQKFISGNFPS